MNSSPVTVAMFLNRATGAGSMPGSTSLSEDTISILVDESVDVRTAGEGLNPVTVFFLESLRGLHGLPVSRFDSLVSSRIFNSGTLLGIDSVCGSVVRGFVSPASAGIMAVSELVRATILGSSGVAVAESG